VINATLLTLFVLPALYARFSGDETLAQDVEEHERQQLMLRPGKQAAK
jgi:hypothetical protein